jgi:hypothetical protein
LKKLIFLMMILGAVLLVQPVLADGLGPNELVNGDFATGDLTGWTQFPGYTTFSVYPYGSPPPNYLAGGGFSGFTTNRIYQIIDETEFSSWNPAGTGKQWQLDFDYLLTGNAHAYVNLWYFDTNGGSQPDILDPGWYIFFSEYLTGSPTLTHYSASGLLDGFQPQWIAYGLGVTTFDSSGYGAFSNNDFEAQCVPVPPSAWLLGSGLLSLVGLRRRIFNI